MESLLPRPQHFTENNVTWQAWVDETAGEIWCWNNPAAAAQTLLSVTEVCNANTSEVYGPHRYIVNTRDAAGVVRYWVWPIGESDEYHYPTYSEAMTAALDPDAHYGKEY